MGWPNLKCHENLITKRESAYMSNLENNYLYSQPSGANAITMTYVYTFSKYIK